MDPVHNSKLLVLLERSHVIRRTSSKQSCAREARKESEAREVEREREAKARKAEQASANLFNAVRRGDVNAVKALLEKGASPSSCTPDGVPLVKYAEESGRNAVVEVLRNWPSGASAA